MSSARRYELPGGLTVVRTQPAVGAVVSGIDLALKIEARQAEGLRQALFAHGVIFLRGQGHIGYLEHRALAEVFGEPLADGHEPERPEIMAIRSEARNPKGIASVWHFDDPYMVAPPAVSVLRAIEPSTFGGDTCFSSAVAAYAGLPAELKEQIAGLRYSTSLEALITEGPGGFGAEDTWRELIARNPPLTQPLVIVHPVTGVPALYTDVLWPRGIVGMDDAEWPPLIERLAREFTRPEYQTRWNWSKGDIAIWDNRLVQHCGVPDHQADRYMERITVRGQPLQGIVEWEGRTAGVEEDA